MGYFPVSDSIHPVNSSMGFAACGHMETDTLNVSIRAVTRDWFLVSFTKMSGFFSLNDFLCNVHRRCVAVRYQFTIYNICFICFNPFAVWGEQQVIKLLVSQSSNWY